jgi:putative SOS response-associated peptidase YedK
MCGRYITVTKIKEIEKRFNVQAKHPQLYTPNTNISHGEYAPVVTGHKPGELQFFQFGFTPAWAKKQFYMINARAEGDHNKEDDPNYAGEKGIINKPMFRKAIRSQRCLIVADCFIEGPKKERLNKPYVVYLKDGERPFALAGIWDTWANQDTGEIVESFAIITTVSNDLMQKIQHHRSPVVLNRDDEQAWIDPSLPLGEVTSMLKPYPAELMNAYPVSPAIKNPRATGIELLEPIGERIYKEYDYDIYKEIQLFGMGESRARNRKKDEGRQGELF